jgi:hypothetical protein
MVSAYGLTGAEGEQTCLALQGTSGAELDMFAYTALGCEDTVSWSRQYYIDSPQLNKILNRVWLLTEGYSGDPSIALAASVLSPDGERTALATLTPQQAPTTSGDSLAIGVYSLEITGSCIKLSWAMPAGSGNISVLGWVLKADLGGEIIEGT